MFTHKSILHNARNRFDVVDKRFSVYAKKKVDLYLFRVISGPFSVHSLLGHWHFGKWWWWVIKSPEIWIDVENPSRADLFYELSFFPHLIQCKTKITEKLHENANIFGGLPDESTVDRHKGFELNRDEMKKISSKFTRNWITSIGQHFESMKMKWLLLRGERRKKLCKNMKD